MFSFLRAVLLIIIIDKID